MTNEPAFPIVHPPVEGITLGGVEYSGMTLRDYFAAKALAALIGHEGKDPANRGKKAVIKLAAWSYEYADAMLEERKC